MTLFFYALCAFGLAYIVGHSRISLPIRERLTRPIGPGKSRFYCPACNEQHIDEGEWATRPHHTHLCLACGKTFETDTAQPWLKLYGVKTAEECMPAPQSAWRVFFVELLECPACFGTWTGFVFGLVVPVLPNIYFPTLSLHPLAAGLLLATCTAATNYLLARLTGITPGES